MIDSRKCLLKIPQAFKSFPMKSCRNNGELIMFCYQYVVRVISLAKYSSDHFTISQLIKMQLLIVFSAFYISTARLFPISVTQSD